MDASIAPRGVRVRLVGPSDTEALLRYHLHNRAFLTPFEPVRSESYFTEAGQRERIERAVAEAASGIGYLFGVFGDMAESELVGQVAVRNVVRGAWQNATLGYSTARDHNGKGYATEAVGRAVAIGFERLGLHRIQAGILPRNAASRRVLEKNGFRFEGRSLRYLQINGIWEDHDMYALTIEDRHRPG
ncbi:MAG: GNAT family N-acetyltransferase [Actinomycetota bacterium]